MDTEEQFLIDAMAAAGKQLQCPLLFRAYADYRHQRKIPKAVVARVPVDITHDENK